MDLYPFERNAYPLESDTTTMYVMGSIVKVR
jgi:hypothetical protein